MAPTTRIRPYLYGFGVVCTDICSIIQKSARIDLEVLCDQK